MFNQKDSHIGIPIDMKNGVLTQALAFCFTLGNDSTIVDHEAAPSSLRISEFGAPLARRVVDCRHQGYIHKHQYQGHVLGVEECR